MVASIISMPGRMAWELIKTTDSSRVQTEVSQFAMLFFSGLMGYAFPKKSDLAFSFTLLLFGGAVYGMHQEPSMDFDHDMKAKKQAFQVVRLVLGFFFGFCVGATIQNPKNLESLFVIPDFAKVRSARSLSVFRCEYFKFLKLMGKTQSVVLYPFLTGFCWIDD